MIRAFTLKPQRFNGVFQCVMHCDAIFKWKNVESGVERGGAVKPNCKINMIEK